MTKKESTIEKKIDVSSSVTTMEAPSISKSQKDFARSKLDALRKEESRLVKGMFQCFETPGATVRVTVKKYKELPVFEQEMTDGMTYEIPLYVARHLNGFDMTAGAAADPEKRNTNIGTCSYPKHGFVLPGKNAEPGIAQMDKGIPVPIVGITRRIKRYGFQSLEFGSEM